DFGWILFLFLWPPFTMWFVAVGIAMLCDSPSSPVFPRWCGYLSLWAAFLTVPAGCMLFFKSGPLAWNGLIALYIPLVIFFIWLLGITYVWAKKINRDSLTAAATAH